MKIKAVKTLLVVSVIAIAIMGIYNGAITDRLEK